MARGRDSKGRFLKRSKGSTALARRGSSSVVRRAPRGGVITVRENITVRQSPRRGGRIRRAARTAWDNRMAIGVTVGAAGYGYLSNNRTTAGYMAMLPTIDAVGPHISRGALLWWVNKQFLGKNKYVDQVALGALAIGGYSFGKGMANSSVTPAVLGGAIGDGDDLVGDLDDDDGDDELGDYDE